MGWVFGFPAVPHIYWSDWEEIVWVRVWGRHLKPVRVWDVLLFWGPKPTDNRERGCSYFFVVHYFSLLCIVSGYVSVSDSVRFVDKCIS